MSIPDLFARLTGALTTAGIPYMFTGSFASSFHGVPRASNDFDLVVSPTSQQLTELKTLLPESDYYFDLDDAQDALKRTAQFNIIDLQNGWKVDLIIRKGRPFSVTEFGRRMKADLEGLSIYMATPEDVILAKLEWAKQSHSERQIEDVAGILRIRAEKLDWDYLRQWIAELGLELEWDRARTAAGLS
jgi:hypothetical protein